MIISPHEQNTPEWLLERLGVPSASMFSKIITSTGKPSTSARGYMNQLLAEFYVGQPVDQVEANYWMTRGTELEDEARDLFQLITEKEVKEVGFCFKDDKKQVGCSPDGLIDKDGLLEIKAPKASTLIGYMLSGKLPAEYKPQVQGQLFVTDKQYCQFMAYHPDLPPFLIRAERDDRYIKLMEEHLDDFIEEMLEKRTKLETKRAVAIN